MSYSSKVNLNAIRNYKMRWGEDDLPPWINASNVETVARNCEECLKQGKSYGELFGNGEPEDQRYDPDTIY